MWSLHTAQIVPRRWRCDRMICMSYARRCLGEVASFQRQEIEGLHGVKRSRVDFCRSPTCTHAAALHGQGFSDGKFANFLQSLPWRFEERLRTDCGSCVEENAARWNFADRGHAQTQLLCLARKHFCRGYLGVLRNACALTAALEAGSGSPA